MDLGKWYTGVSYISLTFFSSFLIYKNEKLQKYQVSKTTENEYVKQWLNEKWGKLILSLTKASTLETWSLTEILEIILS